MFGPVAHGARLSFTCVSQWKTNLSLGRVSNSYVPSLLLHSMRCASVLDGNALHNRFEVVADVGNLGHASPERTEPNC